MNKTLIIILFTIVNSANGQEPGKVLPIQPELMLQFPNVRDFTISPDENEAYFSAQSPLGELSVIIRIEKDNGIWEAPAIISSSGKFMDLEPFLSPDALKLYFASNRPTDDTSNEPKDYNIWYVQRENTKTDWSKPISVGLPVNTEHNEFYPSVSSNNNLYFTSDPPDSKGKDDIYFSQWKNGQYTKPISLSDSINSESYEFNAYIAPDESYLLYSGYNREDGFGSGDLYISYLKKDLSWSKAKNLGSEINSKYMDYCPFVHTETKMLYFTSRRSNLKVPSAGLSSTTDYLSLINSYENGLSRVYVVSIDHFLPPSK